MSTYEACPLPDPNAPDSDAVRQMCSARRIAVVGLSDDPSRASYRVARYLLDVGKEIIPVNPTHSTIMGLKCYPTLDDVPGHIDVVDVFRRPEFCPAVAESAVRIHAGGLWLQAGIVSAEARKLAAEAGMPYVEDRCLMVEHAHLSQDNRD